MITKVGFEQAGCSTVAPKQRAQHHLAVRRCKSALSLSLGLQSPPTTSSMDASIAHTDSYGDLTAVGSTSSMGSASSVSGLEVQHAHELDAHADAGKAIEIPYTRAARARLDAAERQGKAFDQQLELLAAVRAYFAGNPRAAPAQQQQQHTAAAPQPPAP